MDIKSLFSKEDAAEFDRLTEKTGKFLSGTAELEEEEDQGYIFSIGFYPETGRYAVHQWEGMKERSVFIVSYPKSGTNWTYEVVRYLLYMHDERQLQVAQSIPIFMMYQSMSGASKFKLIEKLPLDRNLFGSHMPPPLMNMEKIKKKKGKFIFVLRNPKDQAVSWFHFCQRPHLNNRPYAKDWNNFLEEYMEGKHHLWTKDGDWYPDHILEWWKYKDDKDVLFICFEDMKKDLKTEIRRMARFLEVPFDDKKINDIAHYCSFDYMYNQMPEHMKMFTREGRVGGWKDWFTVAQSEKMDQVIDEKMGASGVKFTYQI